MNTMVTVQGWLGNDPVVRTAAGVPVANFRVASTPRVRRASGEWVDGRTQWYGVSAWRALAEHCGRSLKRGDPVLLHGRLEQRSYVNKSNLEVVVMEIEALSVGHDLSRGISLFSKAAPAPRREPERAAEPEPARTAATPWGVPGATSTAAPAEVEPEPEDEPEPEPEVRVDAA